MVYMNVLLVGLAAIALNVDSAQAASGKGKGGSSVAVSEGSVAVASTRVRLVGKIQEGDLDLLIGQEISAKFESRDARRRLKLEVESFPMNEKITASIKIGNVDHLLGDLVYEAESENYELDFREGNWLVGLPMNIPAGSIVTFKFANETYQVVLNPK